MNTSDLRDTLASHATFEDDGLTARVVGVRERVRVVRRRRRAAVGGTVVAVLAIGAAGVALPKLTNDAAPASRELAGHTAPATLESLGYTYSFERGVEGNGKVVITVPKSDRPSLITWSTQGRDDRVVVRSGGGGDPYRSSRGDFADFTMSGPSDSAMKYTLTGDGPIGVAVYQLADQAPAGVTKDHFTYRDQVDGGALLAAKIGDVGDNELELTFTMPTGGLSISSLCQTSRPRMVSVSFNGSGGAATSCQADEGRDAVGGSRWALDEVMDKNGRRIKAGEKVRVRVWISDRRSASRKSADDDSVRLGVGIYSVPQVTVAGMAVDKFIEFDGHLWRLAETEAGEAGSDRVRLRVAGRAPRVVGFVVKHTGEGMIRMARFDREGKLLESGGGAWESTLPEGMSGGGYDLVTEDAVVGLTTEGNLIGPRTRFALVSYERVD